MESVTYYLKYRPQKVAELDLADVRDSLEKILKSGRIPHAFLFSGPKGTGKTSTARIIAKAVNCLKNHKNGAKGDYEPCNKCEVCQEVNLGNALDLIEIDAASNRGIDDIRQLKEKIKLSPAKCRYKVYIIDEVHMLTNEAFNALLKTLEEPPAHAIFILCTTEPEKLPKTIISRCTQIKFKKAKAEEMARSLQRTVKGEGLTVDKETLLQIAKNVDGSFRDAQKVLDQLSADGKKISLKQTKTLLGRIEDLDPVNLLTLLFDKKDKEALLEIDKIVSFGSDLDFYIQSLLEILRQLLLVKAGIVDLDQEPIDSPVKQLASRIDKRQIMKLIGLFAKAAIEAKISPIPQLPLELVAIEWCDYFDDQGQIPEGKKITIEPDQQTEEKPVEVKKDNEQKLSMKPLTTKGNGVELVLSCWNEILLGVRPLNHSVEALLRASRPIKLDGNFLTLEVFYKFHKERLETSKCRQIVEEVASNLLSLPVKIKCVLGEKRPIQVPHQESQPKEEKDDIIDIANDIFNGKLID